MLDDDPKKQRPAASAALEALAADCVRRFAPLVPEGVGYILVLADRKKRYTVATSALTVEEASEGLAKIAEDQRRVETPGAPPRRTS